MEAAPNKTIKKVWSGYECPACFGIFRVVKGNEHREAICPRCETILRLVEAPELPEEQKQTLPVSGEVLVSPSGSIPVPAGEQERTSGHSPEDSSSEEPGAVRKRRRKIKSSGPDWDRKDHVRRREEAWKLPVILLIGGIVLLAGALVAVEFLNSKKKGQKSSVSAMANASLGLDQEPEAPEQKEVSEIDLERDRDLILEAVRLFLEAETVEDLLVMVRPAQGVASKIRRYYQDEPYEKPKIRQIAEDGSFSMVDQLVSLNIVMQDFVTRPIALEKIDDQYRVDWESWVGYSELSWEEFFEIKPRRGRVFRVLVSPVDYYNFDFSDDDKWRSFQLTSADRETVVYGYVPSGSPMVSELMPLSSSEDEAAFMVRLRYPLETTSNEQVLIEEVLGSGWVLDRELE